MFLEISGAGEAPDLGEPAVGDPRELQDQRWDAGIAARVGPFRVLGDVNVEALWGVNQVARTRLGSPDIGRHAQIF